MSGTVNPQRLQSAEDRLSALVDRLREFATESPRTIVGLCGPPGVGKSSLARQLVAALGPDVAAVVPLDGFHLANRVLDELGIADHKGAPPTFDVDGYAAMLGRLATPDDAVVYAPEFHRDLEESYAGSLAVPRKVPLVVTEGNYLLLPDPRWRRARAHLHEVWYLELDDQVRRERLIARHRSFGRTESEARAWVEQVDEPNARRIAATAAYADLVVGLPADAHRDA
jgi:pantothenate kinase